MGSSASAYLFYGYDLGGSETGWKIEEVDKEYSSQIDYDQLGWLTEEQAEEDADFNFVEEAEKRLLREIGGVTGTWRDEGYYDRRREAQVRVGVVFHGTCTYDYPIYVLAAHTSTSYDGEVETIHFNVLDQRRIDEDWDGKLDAALKVLNIHPIQAKAAWLLASHYG